MSARSLFIVLAVAATAAGQGRETHKFTVEGELTAHGLDPTDKNAGLGFVNGGFTVFPTTWEKALSMHPFTAHGKAVTAIAFLPDGKQVATASLDGTVKVWDVAACRKYQDAMFETAGKGKAPVPTPKLVIQAHAAGVTALAVRADGLQFASGGADGAIKVWDAKTGKVAVTIGGAHPGTGGVKAVHYRPDAEHLVSAGADKTVKVWDAKKGALVRKTEALKTPVNGLAVSPDGARAAVATVGPKKGAGGQVVVFDLETGKPESTIDGHDDAVTCLVFHPKTAHLATGGTDKTVRVWDLKTREQVSVAENAEPIRVLAVLPGGTRFAAISATRVRWWDGFGAKKP